MRHVLIPNEQHAGAASAILMLLMMMMITPAAGAICPSTSIINTPNTVWEAVDCSNVTNLVVQTATNLTIRIINSSTIASYFLPYNLSLIVLNSATISGLSLEILSSNITASSLLVFPWQSSNVKSILGVSVYIHSSVIYAANVGFGAIALRTSLNSNSDAHDINVTVDNSYILVTSQGIESHEVHAFLHILASGSLRNIFVVMRNSSLNGAQSSRESKALYFIDMATDHASSAILVHLVDCAMNIGSTLVSTNPIDEVTDYGSVIIGLRFYATTLGDIATLSGVNIMLTRLHVIGNTTSTFTFVSFESGVTIDSSVIVLQSVYVTTTVAGPMSIADDMSSRYSSVFSATRMINSKFLVRNTHINASIVIGMLNRNLLSLVDTAAVQLAELSCTNNSFVTVDGNSSVTVRNVGDGCFSTYNANAYFSILAFLTEATNNATVVIENVFVSVVLDAFCPVQRSGYFNRLGSRAAAALMLTTNSGIYGFLVGTLITTGSFTSSNIMIRGALVNAVPPNISLCTTANNAAYSPSPLLLQVFVSLGPLMFNTKAFLLDTLSIVGPGVPAVSALRVFIATGTTIDFGTACSLLQTKMTVIDVSTDSNRNMIMSGVSGLSGRPSMNLNVSLAITLGLALTGSTILITTGNNNSSSMWSFSVFHDILSTISSSTISTEGLQSLRPSTNRLTAAFRLTGSTSVNMILRLVDVHATSLEDIGATVDTAPHLLLLEHGVAEKNTSLIVMNSRATGFGRMIAASVGYSSTATTLQSGSALGPASRVRIQCLEWDGSATVPLGVLGVVRGQAIFMTCLPSVSASLDATRSLEGVGGAFVPAPTVLETPVALAALVATAGLSFVQSASVSSPLSRSLAVLRIAQCSGVDALEGPLGVDAHPTRISIGDDVGGSQRGSLIMNICVVWGGLALLSTGEALFLGWHRDDALWTVREALSHLQLPGAWSMFVMPLLSPVVSSAVQLISGTAQGALSGGDAVGGVVALVIVALITAAVMYWLRPSFFHSVVEGRVGNSAWYHQGCMIQTARRRVLQAANIQDGAKELVLFMGAPLGAWRARRIAQASTSMNNVYHDLHVQRRDLLCRHLRPLYGDTMAGRHWWLVVDLTSGIVIGVLGGIMPSTTPACDALLWVAAVVLSCVAVASIALGPIFTSRIDCFVYQVCAAGGAIIAIGAAAGASDDVLSALTIAMLPISLIGMIVGALKWLWSVGQRFPLGAMDLGLPSIPQSGDPWGQWFSQATPNREQNLNMLVKLACRHASWRNSRSRHHFSANAAITPTSPKPRKSRSASPKSFTWE